MTDDLIASSEDGTGADESDGAETTEAGTSEDEDVLTDVEAEFAEMKWANEGVGKELRHEDYETLRYGVARALYRLGIPADGELEEEEMELVQEYLCDKGMEVALSCDPVMEAVVDRIVKSTTEFEVAEAGAGGRLAEGHERARRS